MNFQLKAKKAHLINKQVEDALEALTKNLNRWGNNICYVVVEYGGIDANK